MTPLPGRLRLPAAPGPRSTTSPCPCGRAARTATRTRCPAGSATTTKSKPSPSIGSGRKPWRQRRKPRKFGFQGGDARVQGHPRFLPVFGSGTRCRTSSGPGYASGPSTRYGPLASAWRSSNALAQNWARRSGCTSPAPRRPASVPPCPCRAVEWLGAGRCTGQAAADRSAVVARRRSSRARSARVNFHSNGLAACS